jgi:hypothetical protein
VPLVLGADGLQQQLQSGDTITNNVSTTSVRSLTNAGSSSIVFGTPVYASAADSCKAAQANAKATANLVGLVYDASIAASGVGNVAESGVLVGTTAQWDAVVTGETGGLVFNSLYFLSATTAGMLTTTPPTTAGSGQCNTLVGRAVSTTEMELILNEPILL